jgi:hypothetical protein
MPRLGTGAEQCESFVSIDALAYVWENLFLACALCNQSFKKNLFPLADPTRRARSHLDDLAAEQPMLIHPADEEPNAFIGFREEMHSRSATIHGRVQRSRCSA